MNGHFYDHCVPVGHHLRIGHDTAQFQFSDKDCDEEIKAKCRYAFVLLQYVGPYVGKVTGCAIEATVVSTLLIFKKIAEASSRRRTVAVKNLSIHILFFILFILLSIKAPQFMVEFRPLIVYLALFWSNFAACRSIIALSISAERVIDAYFPITYRSYRNLVPNWIVLAVGIAFGVSEEFVFFNLCSYDMIIPPSCRVFGCAINQCFYYFWTIHKDAIFSAIVLLSIMLSTKLFIWNNLRHKKNNQLSKANRLALLNTVTVLVFDFLPSFCPSM
ncbi:Protein CBG06603 [Caenorhabditis briggsae]|uniref:Protein CBG06603 n=1 Tax=Caenorhabditis briggsae TaxID=6238 RepID=A8X2M5_CAEBR|nr:Protein CBG06603 [Caenorhabditis briggsae]CAP26885.2 Protein CBG06603 [Caenorhabditis briggsae]